MIVVGAMAEGGKGAYFSNWSQTKVDVAAPGMKIYSTTPKGVEGPGYGSTYGLYGFMSGTSMAAPHVAGAAGLLMSKFPVSPGEDRHEGGQQQIEQGTGAEIGERRVGKECRSRWSPYH